MWCELSNFVTILYPISSIFKIYLYFIIAHTKDVINIFLHVQTIEKLCKYEKKIAEKNRFTEFLKLLNKILNHFYKLKEIQKSYFFVFIVEH